MAEEHPLPQMTHGRCSWDVTHKEFYSYCTNGLSSRSSFSSDEDEDDDSRLPHPRERTHVNSKGFTDFCVKNINAHTFGRKEIQLAESEMPALLSLRTRAVSGRKSPIFPQRGIVFTSSACSLQTNR